MLKFLCYTFSVATSTLWSYFTRCECYQEGKTSLDLLEKEIVTGSGISWAMCKSAP